MTTILTPSLIVIIGALTVASFFCANGHGVAISLIDLLRHTFAPKNWQEFAFPPCPICWATRAAVIVLLYIAVIKPYFIST